MQEIPEKYRNLPDAEYLTDRRLSRIIETARRRQAGLMVVMEDVHDPHNLSAIARSCDAFGIQKVTFTVENEDLFDPKKVGKVSSASASKWLDYQIFHDGTESALRTLQSEGWHVMATWVSDDAPSIYQVDFTQYDKLALMLGNEHAGISETAIRMADSYVYIPMMGMIQSFNVSVAAAISLFEITRQRKSSQKDFFVSEEEADNLIADFILRGQ